jgi:nuclear transport factor 2 (NTF2) superfamily protein
MPMRLPIPPLAQSTAVKVRSAESAWNSCDSECAGGQWFRSVGDESREFYTGGLDPVRHASAGDAALRLQDRKLIWDAGPCPAGHRGLSNFGL